MHFVGVVCVHGLGLWMAWELGRRGVEYTGCEEVNVVMRVRIHRSWFDMRNATSVTCSNLSLSPKGGGSYITVYVPPTACKRVITLRNADDFSRYEDMPGAEYAMPEDVLRCVYACMAIHGLICGILLLLLVPVFSRSPSTSLSTSLSRLLRLSVTKQTMRLVGVLKAGLALDPLHEISQDEEIAGALTALRCLVVDLPSYCTATFYFAQGLQCFHRGLITPS